MTEGIIPILPDYLSGKFFTACSWAIRVRACADGVGGKPESTDRAAIGWLKGNFSDRFVSMTLQLKSI